MTTESLKQFLRNHPRIDLIQYILRKKISKSSECRKILELEKNPLFIQYRHYGSLNKDKHIYYIKIGLAYKAMGYCSLLRITLLHLAYAERLGLQPVIEWTKDLLYTENTIKNGTENSFEYFFQNTSNISIADVLESDLVVTSKIYDINLMVDKLSYKIDENEIRILSNMIKKYLIFNEFGKHEIYAPCRELTQRGSFLGIHVRGTDFKKGYSRHPVMVTVDEYLEEAKNILEKKKFDFVFLATDEQEVVKKFEAVFKEKLFYYKSFRSSDGTPLHYNNGGERKDNKYLLGMEILKDVFTLGNCDGLLAGFSNVSIMARAIKESLNKPYQYEKIIDKGINYNLKECSLFVKQ